MKGRSAIRRCCQLQSDSKRRKVTVCGLCSLPDDVALKFLAQVSRYDLAALAMASKSHRSLVVSDELCNMRWKMGCIKRYVYVHLRILPDESPRWFILHPEQRLLKQVSISSSYYMSLKSSSSFVTAGMGVYVIGGLIMGKPTSDVWVFNCFTHTSYPVPSMKMARASASACLHDGKIYVFGGCRKADSSNWAEVFDMKTQTWDFLFVSAPRNIQHSVVVREKGMEDMVYAVDEDARQLSFSLSKRVFCSGIKLDCSEVGYTTQDWCILGSSVFCLAPGGRILWRSPKVLVWKEVKGLEQLQHSLTQLPMGVTYDITKLCISPAFNLLIFWNVKDAETVELWSAEISIEGRKPEVWGTVLWSHAVLKVSPLSRSGSVDVLFADSVYA